MKDVRSHANAGQSILQATARTLVLLVCLGTAMGLAFAVPQGKGQKAFATPEDAVSALVAAVRANDRTAFTAVAGDALDQLSTGDKVQDNISLMVFAKRLLARIDVIKTDESTAVLYTGFENVLFPIPIVKGSQGWYFDVEAGKQKILDQRIGLSELRAVEVLRLYVRAQKQYASEDRDGDGVTEYASKFLSSEGKRDGLYWPNNDMSPESPFGPLVSLAKAQGYSKAGTGQEPFQGYYFRLLTRQGAGAPGGAKDFTDSGGNMTGGFACIAYPARWGASGIQTFIVGTDGVVFEKNLGSATATAAGAITVFDPDKTWGEVKR